MIEELKVEVTQQDCDLGCRGTERYCVVSTAIGRLMPEANRIETNRNTIRYTVKIGSKTYRVVFRTPAAVQIYLREFDAGADPRPMKFTLTNPQIAEKLPTPKGKAKTPSFKPQEAAQTRRSVRVFGEKAFA